MSKMDVRELADALAGKALPETGPLLDAYAGMAQAIVDTCNDKAFAAAVETWLKSGRSEPDPEIRRMLMAGADRRKTLEIVLPRLQELAREEEAGL